MICSQVPWIYTNTKRMLFLTKFWEIADTTIWLHTDTRDNSTRNRIENCLGHVIALGMSCSRKQPKERALIQDAAIEMHAIRDSYQLVVEHKGVVTPLQ